MTSTMTDIDPFAGGDSVPAVSFKDAAVGTIVTGTVLEAPSLVQSRDYETGDPAVWPDGNKKMSVVIKLGLDTGEEKSLWAAKPSAMFAAIAEAQKTAGQRITVGGTLAVKYTGDKPNAKNPRLNPQKLYAAQYTPPAAADPFAAPPAQSAAPANTAAVFNGTQGGGSEPPF